VCLEHGGNENGRPLTTAPPLKKKRTVGFVVQNPVIVSIKGSVTSASLPLPVLAPRGKNWLGEALLEMSPTRPQRHAKDVVASVVFHILFIAALVLPSLYYTQTIDLKKFTQTFLVAPPPPPPAPPAPAATKVTTAPRHSFINAGKLLAPTVIPKTIVIVKEEPFPPDTGVMGGVPGGQLGGVIGGIVNDASRTYVPVPPAPQPKAPIRVGGRVRRPRLLVQPAPIYPILAKQTKLEGIVLIDAVIDTVGNVVEMRVVSGNSLLIPAALEAVRQWKYEPTYLNDQAIAVQLIVTVTFRLQY
jgi:periplasmic protein TonB